MRKAFKKAKPSPQKGAFASIFKKANQRVMSKASPGHKASPGRQKTSVTAKVTTKTGSFAHLN